MDESGVLVDVVLASAVGEAAEEAATAQATAEAAGLVAAEAATVVAATADATAGVAADLDTIKQVIVQIADRQDLLAEALALLMAEVDDAESTADTALDLAESVAHEAIFAESESEQAVTEVELNGESGESGESGGERSDAGSGAGESAGNDGDSAAESPPAEKPQKRQAPTGKRFRFGKH